MVLTVISTSGYTYLSPPVIVFNRYNWRWGSCPKKRQSSVFEQETIISELNQSSLVLWFSPFSNICTHALNMKAQFLVGHSSRMDDLPEVLWTGRALASEQRTRACLGSDWGLQLTGVTWVLWGNHQALGRITEEGLQFPVHPWWAWLLGAPAQVHGIRPAPCSTS